MQHSSFGCGNSIHPGRSWICLHSASEKWWNCCYLRKTPSNSTLGYRYVLHPGFCRPCSHCASAKRRPGRCVWTKWWRTVQYSSFAWWKNIHPGVCRRKLHGAPPKWWLRSSLRNRLWWTVPNSSTRAWNSLYWQSHAAWHRPGVATQLCLWGWWNHSDMLEFGRTRSVTLKCKCVGFGLEYSPKDCTGIEGQPSESSTHLAWGWSLSTNMPWKSGGHCCQCCRCEPSGLKKTIHMGIWRVRGFTGGIPITFWRI